MRVEITIKVENQCILFTSTSTEMMGITVLCLIFYILSSLLTSVKTASLYNGSLQGEEAKLYLSAIKKARQTSNLTNEVITAETSSVVWSDIAYTKKKRAKRCPRCCPLGGIFCKLCLIGK